MVKKKYDMENPDSIAHACVFAIVEFRKVGYISRNVSQKIENDRAVSAAVWWKYLSWLPIAPANCISVSE